MTDFRTDEEIKAEREAALLEEDRRLELIPALDDCAVNDMTGSLQDFHYWNKECARLVRQLDRAVNCLIEEPDNHDIENLKHAIHRNFQVICRATRLQCKALELAGLI